MDEYEVEINDIDELRSKFYDMWGKYRDKVIYSDNERRLFEAIQAVSRAFFERMHMYPDSRNKNEDTFVHDYVHDVFKEMFRDPNYEIIWQIQKVYLQESTERLTDIPKAENGCYNISSYV